MNDLVEKKTGLCQHRKPHQTIQTHVPDSGELLILHHHFFSRGTASTHSKSVMVAYQGGVHTVGVGIVIILLCVKYITSNIHLNNVT